MGRRIDYSASYSAYEQLRLVQESDEDTVREEDGKIVAPPLVKKELETEDNKADHQQIQAFDAKQPQALISGGNMQETIELSRNLNQLAMQSNESIIPVN